MQHESVYSLMVYHQDRVGIAWLGLNPQNQYASNVATGWSLSSLIISSMCSKASLS